MSDETAAVTRRWVLVSIGALLDGAVGLLVAVPVVGYLWDPFARMAVTIPGSIWVTFLNLPSETRLASFVNPKTCRGMARPAKAACWVRRTQERKFQVFAIDCAQLGCPVRFSPQSELFMCPCHGGVYYADGLRAAGPPPRGLFEYPFKVQNSKLLINGALRCLRMATSASVRKESSACTG